MACGKIPVLLISSFAEQATPEMPCCKISVLLISYLAETAAADSNFPILRISVSLQNLLYSCDVISAPPTNDSLPSHHLSILTSMNIVQFFYKHHSVWITMTTLSVDGHNNTYHRIYARFILKPVSVGT